MVGRYSKPIDLIVMEGKSHKTKEEIRLRKEKEIKPDTENVKCPDWLCDIARAEWKRIEQDLMDLGLLTNLDVSQLAIYCDAYAKYIAATNDINENGLVTEYTNKNGTANMVTNPNVQIASKYALLVKNFCNEFGLSPSSRARMALPKKDDQANEKQERLRGLI